VADSSLYEKLGSLSVVNSLANEFYDVMDRDPKAKELRGIHPKNLHMSKNTLYRFLSHWSGGPEIFNAEYTNSTWLELRHRHVDLQVQHQQQWLYCMQTAMNNLELDERLVQELLSRFSNLINSMVAKRSARSPNS
jgi:hemoglobin